VKKDTALTLSRLEERAQKLGLPVSQIRLYGDRDDMPRRFPSALIFARKPSMSLLVVVMPVIYVAISGAIVSAFFCLICYAALQVTIVPLARGRASWLIAAGLCAVGLVGTEWGGPHQALFVNDVVIGIAVVGAANLWVQSGMRSAHIAWFAGFLAVYDFVATPVTSSTDDFIERVSGIPFSPEWVFTLGPNPVAIGLGDLLLSVFPLAAHRSFGAVAGIVAMATGTAVVAADTVAYHYGVLHGAAPVLDAVPLPDGPTGFWAAIDGTRIVGVAPTPGAARRKARENGCTAVPQVREITAT
jgi:hypothetical protein